MLGNLGGLLGGTTAGQGLVIQTPVPAGTVSNNVSNPVVIVTPQPTKEGYFIISNYQQNEVAVLVWKFLLQKYIILSTATVVRVLKQDLPSVSYQFVIQFSYTATVKLTYVFTVSVSAIKTFSITKG